jgi:hypothetical protein
MKRPQEPELITGAFVYIYMVAFTLIPAFCIATCAKDLGICSNSDAEFIGCLILSIIYLGMFAERGKETSPSK